MTKKTKALVMFSGGLDSMLAVQLLKEQGIVVEAVCFKSNFFNCEQAKISSKNLDIKLHEVDISNEILDLVKNPPSGHGKCLNPCIDCHALMMRKSKELIKKSNFDFLATGEVLGQRPFSQNKQALNRVKNLGDIDVLRPLSAKLMTPTEVEKKGLVDREKLEDISGRSRDRQKELAKKYKIKNYPTPAGGCLLTDRGFSKRLGESLENFSEADSRDIELIKNGRVFWAKLGKKSILIIVGRHKEDNEALEKLAKKGDIMVKLKEVMGPNTLLRFFNTKVPKVTEKTLEIDIPVKLNTDKLDLEQAENIDEILKLAGLLTGWYATKARGKKVELELLTN